MYISIIIRGNIVYNTCFLFKIKALSFILFVVTAYCFKFFMYVIMISAS